METIRGTSHKAVMLRREMAHIPCRDGSQTSRASLLHLADYGQKHLLYTGIIWGT